ncbi:aminotransferase class I/II-fold pyridoxal phosphate-dependent enzyme [Cryobacterium sp. TmT2-59]|uniref:DegT/DnrJ/EryC1/StrS family aminotransferase n=1 Tax=Cryobacterium sp. TmT2-59 TaxID=1259264 RepID=UPI00106C5B51|nr:aminotransferase class I/II-fold pyridoxal phosphate-dependent enzyme [Cryobacterium sp. TmT2-59]TFC89813.1 aminotransferase class I/II-fold pyridoxal phosphate-dependent enzyme [Cryobacterium sp. TmT2-59]
MSERIYMSSPDVGDLEEQYMVAAIRSGWIAPLGPDVDAFEVEMAERVGVEQAVALSSGTAALHLGLLGLGIGPGDTVLTSTMTFAATANAIVYTGAEPFFIDCELESGNIDPALLRQTIEQLRGSGEKAAAIVPVDLLGKAANYTEICAIADEYEIPVLADAAESLGASHEGRPAGSFGRASILSFNGNKVMTTSGGGMLLTDDLALAAHTRYLATQARQPVTHYEHTEIGYNYRLSNILAALGRAQLSRLDEMIARRREMRERYRELFARMDGVEIFGGASDDDDNCWLTSIVIDSAVTGWSPADLSADLMAVNIESRPLWKPMHMQPVFSASRAVTNGNSQRLFETGLTLPSGSALGRSEIDRVTSRLRAFNGVTV